MRDYSKEYRRKEDAGIAKYGKREWNRMKRVKSNQYEKTKKGFVMRMYRNMKSRVTECRRLRPIFI